MKVGADPLLNETRIGYAVGREMPSFCIRDWRVVRLSPRRVAAP